jgi:Tol biopolymer transport system component
MAGARPFAALSLVALAVPAVAILAMSVNPAGFGATPPAQPSGPVADVPASSAIPTPTVAAVTPDLGPAVRQEAIVFASNEDGDFDLYRIDPDGGEPYKVLESFHDETWPAISPDGRTIAFARGPALLRNLWLMDADGTDLQQLTSGPSDDQQPEWSPDGNRLAFIRQRVDGNEDLYVMSKRRGKLDPATVIRLTGWRSVEEWPAWTANGERIMVGTHYWGANRDLAVIDPDRPVDISAVERLTDSAGYEVYGSWIGNTDRILFAQGTSYATTRLLTMDESGRNVQFLRDGRGAEFLPDVSPDGKEVVYSAGPGGQLGSNVNLFIQPIRGGRPRQLTRGLDNARQADWASLQTRRSTADEQDRSAFASQSPT